MLLNVQERLTLVRLIPEKGNFDTWKIYQSLKDVLYPSEEEIKKFNIKQEDNQISWNMEGSKDVEIKLTKVQKEILQSFLEELDKKEELTFAHFSVFKKFKK